MKKAANVVLLVFVIANIASTVQAFNHAHSWLEVFKAVFWLLLGSYAFWTLIENIHKNRWPWDSWK